MVSFSIIPQNMAAPNILYVLSCLFSSLLLSSGAIVALWPIVALKWYNCKCSFIHYKISYFQSKLLQKVCLQNKEFLRVSVRAKACTPVSFYLKNNSSATKLYFTVFNLDWQRLGKSCLDDLCTSEKRSNLITISDTMDCLFIWLMI